MFRSFFVKACWLYYLFACSSSYLGLRRAYRRTDLFLYETLWFIAVNFDWFAQLRRSDVYFIVGLSGIGGQLCSNFTLTGSPIVVRFCSINKNILCVLELHWNRVPDIMFLSYASICAGVLSFVVWPYSSPLWSGSNIWQLSSPSPSQKPQTETVDS